MINTLVSNENTLLSIVKNNFIVNNYFDSEAAIIKTNMTLRKIQLFLRSFSRFSIEAYSKSFEFIGGSPVLTNSSPLAI